MNTSSLSNRLTSQKGSKAVAKFSHSEDSGGSDTREQFTLVGLDVSRKLLDTFIEGFRRFQVDIRSIHVQTGECSGLMQANACVLPLSIPAVALLKKASWYLPRGTVIYGIGDTRRLNNFPDVGVNALLHAGTRQNISEAIEATQPLLHRGIGDCARVPIAVVVQIETEGKKLVALTRNVGYGGMAVRLDRMTTLAQEVSLSFCLPGSGAFSLLAVPLWYSGRFVGLQFRSSKKESSLKEWVKSYCSLGAGQTRVRSAFA